MKDELRKEMIETSASHWWFVARRRILEGVVKTLRLPTDSRILEVGCGDGSNLPWLVKYGKVDAVELADDLRLVAEVRGIATVHAGYLPDGLPAGVWATAYDAVVMFDVLEHIEADAVSLKTIKTLLKPNGKLVIAVPAFQWLWSAHDEAHHHQRRYTKQTLQRVIVDAGFTLEYISYYNFLLFPLGALVRLFGRLLGAKQSKVNEIPSPSINVMFEKAFALERFLVPRFTLPFGLSLIAVAKA
jgi:SAM-dependent methyltransferase